MKKLEHHKVIIVGGGIAGLSAAWHLKKKGISSLVLESEEIVGGRMKSVQIEDALIDCGAQFLSTAYSIIPHLIKETGLENQFVETSEWGAVVNHEGIALMNPRKPWHLVSNHLLSIRDLLRLIFNQFKLFYLHKKTISLNDINAWIKYDNEQADTWITKNFGKAVAKNLTSAFINGLYFQTLQHSSASFVAPAVAFAVYQPKAMTLKKGIGYLPQTLAKELNVKTNVLVSEVNETENGVYVQSNKGTFEANHVIVTVPAPIAKNIINSADKESLALFNTPYSSSILVSLLIDNTWSLPSQFSSAYGLLFNPEVKSKIAAIAIENNKCVTRRKKGFLLNIMLEDVWSKKSINLSDEIIYAEIQSDVEAIFPNIYQHVQMKKLFRWEYAMPCTPIGRANAVKQYRDSRNSHNRVWLAGDYLGLPWSDSAAQTGIWAANQVSNKE